MPPTIRRLLTALHSLLILAMYLSVLPPLTVAARPQHKVSARPVVQEQATAPTPVATAAPAPVIKIPEAPNPVDHSIPPHPIPREDFYAGEPLPDVGRNMPPLEINTTSLLPVAMRVELDRYVLARGEQATLQVNIGSQNMGLDREVEVTLTLPPQLQFVGDTATRKVWTYSPATLAARVEHRLIVEVNPMAELPAVVEITLSAAASGYESVQRQWLLGITATPAPEATVTQAQSRQTANGAILHAAELTVLLPANAAPMGAQLQYTELFTAASPGASPVTTSTVPVTPTEPLSAEVSMTPTAATTTTLPVDTTAVSTTQPLQENGVVRLPVIRQTAEGAGAVTTELVPALTGSEQDVPAVEPGTPLSSSVATVEDNGITFFRLWHVAAEGMGAAHTTPTEAHPTFAEPVLMVVDVRDLVSAGVKMGLVDLWTRPDATQPWEPVINAYYDRERQVWVAWLHHFSEFGAGIKPAASQERLPSVDGFSSDRHTGAATVNVPVISPDGLGGLNPNLSLNYSTGTVDDVFAELGHDDGSKRIQANMAGYGWSLGGVNYITKYRDADKNVYYTLILNGASYDIYENNDEPGMYETDPMSFAAITNTLNLSTSVWMIKTTDGMTYEFGGDVPDLHWPSSEISRTLHVEMRTNTISPTRELEVVAWYLKHVEDTAGNAIDYGYRVERADISFADTGEGGCDAQVYAGEPIENTDYDGETWYNPVTRLISVTWSSNVGKYGAAKDPRLQLLLAYSDDRTDFDHPNDPGTEDDFVILDGCQPRKTRYRLEEIQVQAREYNSNNWQLLRRYNLEPSYADEGTNDEKGEDELLRHLQLAKIQEFGVESGVYITQTFTYTSHVDSEGDTENSIWLTEVDNGFGGKTTYDYKISDADCLTDHGENCDETSDLTRHLVKKMVVEDGQQPPTYRVTGYNYAAKAFTVLYKGRLRYLGVNHATTTIYTPTTDFNQTLNYTTALQQVRFEDLQFHQMVPGLNSVPDARHGRLKEMRVYDYDSGGNKLYARSVYTWTSQIWNGTTFVISDVLNSQGYWISLTAKDEWTDGAGKRTTYTYDPAAQGGTQFGNVTAVEESAHAHPIRDEPDWRADLVVRRRTETTYYPNDGALTDKDDPYLVSLPARVVVKNGLGECLTEDRAIYADDLFQDAPTSIQNRDGAYTAAAETAFVIKTERVINNCPYATANGNREDANLLVTTYSRDPYGNELARSSHNGANETITINTEYDTFYHLFPLARYNDADPNLVAEASYYGVNGVAIDGTYGYWGAMRENCAVNDICMRWGYDQYGRKTYQWERQVQGSGWPSASAADVVWGYRQPGELGPEQTTYYVTEWRAPRCAGNYVRRHYDGLGQLVGEQKSYQDYHFTGSNCLPGDTGTTSGHELVTFYQYDALGNQTVATMPQLYQHPYDYYDIMPNWDVRTRATYDPLSRVVYQFAPNDEQTLTEYFGRFSMVSSPGRNGDDIKRLQSRELGPLGYLRKLHLVRWEGSDWVYDSTLEFSFDSVGRILKVVHPSTLGTSTYVHDNAGRMTSMNDIDLGDWSYVYNRLGQLTDQADARGVHTCLYYDDMARLEGKEYLGSACPATSSTYDEIFTYGSAGTAAANQLTQVTLLDPSTSSAEYTKTVSYTSVGQVMTETVSYPAAGPYSTGYRYDPYGRLEQMLYPDADNELVSYGYNGMGLHSAMTSTLHSTLVDGVGYDVLGRMAAAHLPAGSDDLFMSQTFFPWEDDSNNSNARLRTINVGTSAGMSNTLGLEFRYDSYGNVVQMSESYNGASAVANSFDYDLYNRLATSTYNAPIAATHHFTFLVSGRPEIFVDKHYAYDPAGDPVYAPSELTRVSDSAKLFFTHDANGNMTQRQFFETSTVTRTQALLWDEANRLARVTQSGTFTETYWYDENGIRTRKHHAGVIPSAQNTGYLNPSANGADTGGDGNGYQSNPANANSNDATFAVDTDSGSGTETTCTSAQKDKHRYYNYNITPPSGATIVGIRVRLDALVDNTTGTPKVCVQLSWDGGTTWTAAKTTGTLSTSEATHLLGSPTDTWGRSWSHSDLSNANFRVRVINVASNTTRDFSLDWAAVKVYYTKPTPSTMETVYPSAVYEVKDGVPTRYYLFNGQAIALRTGTEEVTYLHRDQVGSVVMSTQNGAVTDSRQYFAYGSKRGGDDYEFESNYTGQRRDETGLLYYNARYYDPELGMFISPDSMIPDPSDYFSYNRYLYSRGNPLKYNDPSGHLPILPLLLKAGASGAADLMMQATMNYLFDPNVQSVEQAFDNVNWWQVSRSAAEGLIPFTVPGGRLGRAAMTASGDVLVNALHYGSAYSAEQALMDFGAGFVSDLAGGEVGTLIDRYGGKAVAQGLHKIGIDIGQIKQLAGVYPSLHAAGTIQIPANKINQMATRGWTPSSIEAVVANPALIRQGAVNRATGNPATYFYRPDGYYVVVEDATGLLVQMSDTFDPGWLDEMTNAPIHPIK